MKKNVLLFFAIMSMSSCFMSSCAGFRGMGAVSQSMGPSHMSCTGIKQKNKTPPLRYYKTKNYKMFVNLQELRDKTSRKAKSEGQGLYRYN